jgi:hypothetical protein
LNLNPEREIESSRKRLGKTSQYLKDQLNYMNYAYWLSFGGKLREAKQAHLTSQEMNNKEPDALFNQTDYDNSMAVLSAITGE